MIRALCSLVAIASVSSVVYSQTIKSSPCPNVFTYDPPVLGEKLDPGTAKWYGTITLSTDITLHALWLNVILDNKANILGNWVGEVTTEDNMNFKIENTKMKLTPGMPILVRFFVQYNSHEIEPKLQSILFNGREICNIEEIRQAIVDYPVSISDNYDVNNEVPIRIDTTMTTIRSTTVLTTRNIYDRSQTKSQYIQTTTAKPNYWGQTKATTTTTEKIKPKYETAKNENKTQVTSSIWNWVQTKVENNQQVKSDSTQAKNKDQTQSTVGATQTKTQPWYQNTTTSDQTKNTNKATNNHQTKSEKLQVATENNSNVKPQTWAKGENIANKQQVTSEDKTKFQVWSQIKVDNEQKKTDNKGSQANFDYQSTTENLYNKGEVWSPGIVQDSETRNKGAQSRPDDRSQYYNQYNDNNRQQAVRPAVYEDTYSQSQTDKRNTGSVSSTGINSHTHVADSQQKKVVSDSYEIGNREEARPVATVALRPVSVDLERNVGIYEVVPIKKKEPVESSGTWSQDQPKLIFESAGSRKTNSGSGNRASSNGYRLTTARPTPTAVQTPDLDTYDAEYSSKEEDSGLAEVPMFYIPNLRPESSCGKVTKKPPSYLPYGSSTSEGQWPWQAALYQQQTVDFKYICGGTLVSRRHVITAAHCVTRKKSRREVNKNTLTVYLGKFNLRTSVDGVQVKFVSKIIIHPAYNATIFSRDLAILELREPVTYTDWVRPACLWPENEIGLRNIVGKRGSVVGWGYDVSGVPREELSLLEMPVVDQETCINSYIEFYEKFTSDYTYCAGYRDGTSVCNGDSGGGMVFKKDNTWYLRGLASLSIARPNEYRCDPKHFVIFTDIAKFLPWIEENILID